MLGLSVTSSCDPDVAYFPIMTQHTVFYSLHEEFITEADSFL